MITFVVALPGIKDLSIEGMWRFYLFLLLFSDLWCWLGLFIYIFGRENRKVTVKRMIINSSNKIKGRHTSMEAK